MVRQIRTSSTSPLMIENFILKLDYISGIYPLHDVHIRKVKVMKRPRFDLTKLMDLHGEGSGTTTVTTDSATGEVVERPEGYEPPTQESV